MTTLPTSSLCLPPHISAKQFMREYWQKKPLLIRNGLPDIIDLLEPADVCELATYDEVTARLLTQSDDNPDNWQLKLSPLVDADLADTPQLWTLLVQNLEQWSMDIATLWQHFDFVPQWQRDDIMVSYAPRGGSVGKHYDQYDVFLVQGFGQRRWQLGKFCDDNTACIPNQPLRLIDDMGDVILDEVLVPGDVLYVPPYLSHYGVAQDDCLTFSFGLRRPSALSLLDTIVDRLSDTTPNHWQQPETQTTYTNHNQHNGEITTHTLDTLKTRLLDRLAQSDILDDAIAACLSQRRFELLAEDAPMDTEHLLEALSNGAHIIKEPAVKLLYTTRPSLTLYCQGERIDGLFPQQKALLRRLADGDNLTLLDLEGFDIDALCDWASSGWITLMTH